MKIFKISIILPYPVTKPSGGPKIMYQYAVKLNERGHQVTIYHSIKRPYKKSKTPIWLKRMMYRLRGVARPKWFTLPENIKSVIVPEISDKYLADADVIMSTWWQMAYAVSELSSSKGKKFNLVQDYEIWNGQNELVDASFKLGLKNLAISKYLQELVYAKSGVLPTYLPNAIDTNKFNLITKSSDRNPHAVIMLHSTEARKGTQFGLEALEIIQKNMPTLKVVFFGVNANPGNLPAFISYQQRPANLTQLYNEAAIFFSPSITEGWALPPAEAMACGCAVVCTNIGGHADYAVDNETALLVQPKNIEEMVTKLSLLLNNAELRNQIAANGNNFITSNFSWQRNIEKLEAIFIGA